MPRSKIKSDVKTKKIDPTFILAFDEFVDQFKNESDRAAVILATAKIDYSLFQLISCFLIPNTTKKDELLDPDENGALSSLSARISLCYRLGIIDAEFTRALHLVRKIRNEFAHEVKDAKLDQPPHRDRIRELTKIVSDTELFVDVKERYFLEKSGLIADFFTTLTILTLRLETLFQKIKPLKANIAYPIVPSNYSGKKSK
jgi:hypothetical protein